MSKPVNPHDVIDRPGQTQPAARIAPPGSVDPQDDLSGGMPVFESMRVAWRGLTNNKMRTGLTMLGIIIGVGAVIAMVSMGQGASASVAAQINQLGTNLLIVMPGSPKARFGEQAGEMLRLNDADAIAARFKSTIVAVAPQARGSAKVKYGDNEESTQVLGTTPNYVSVFNSPIGEGRFITAEDVHGRTKVAVVGQTVVDNLFGSTGEDPVGKQITVNRIPFTVIGVMKAKGSGAFGQDQDDIVIVPITTALRRLFNRTNINMIGLEARSQKDIDLVTEEVSSLLRQRHHLLPPFPDNDDFVVRNQASIMQTSQSVTGALTALLAGVAVVSLVVGGIGIMNIMLVSVTERTREIGLRKAVGATSGDILMQFLIESLVMALMGGVIGILIGAGLSAWASTKMGWPISIQPGVVMLAAAVSGGIGVVFGIYPAAKAANQNPIDALRYE